ncbi:MAG TPA: hypothetical protein VEC16_05200 [Alphaproteobacteria bacterium]|nr:hypothetical protein [Alphaproteobacteria bacterium]
MKELADKLQDRFLEEAEYQIPGATISSRQLKALLTDMVINLQPVQKFNDPLLKKNYSDSMEAIVAFAKRYNMESVVNLDCKYGPIEPENTNVLVDKVDTLYTAFNVLSKPHSPITKELNWLGRSFLSTIKEYNKINTQKLYK